MKKIIDDKNKIVYFEGDYPTCMAIPHLMEAFPGYIAQILNRENFQRRLNEQKSL